MRPPPNKALRAAIPLGLLLAGIGILFVVLKNTNTALQTPASTSTPASATQPETTATPPPAPPASVQNAPVEATAKAPEPEAPAASPAPPPSTEPVESAATKPADASAPPARLTVRKHPMPVAGYSPLGSLVPHDKGGRYEMELRFCNFGSGVERLTLANHREEVLKPEQHVLQAARTYAKSAEQRLAAFSVKGLVIDGVEVGLGVDRRDPAATYWREVSPGEFEATIESETGEPILRVLRRFTLPENSYEFGLEQTFTNLSGRPLKVVLHDIGPIDQPQGVIRYGGDPRHIRFGFLDDPQDDPSRTVLSPASSVGMLTRQSAIGSANTGGEYPTKTLWPNPQSAKEKYSLVWSATTSRYFTVAAYNPLPPGAGAVTDQARFFNAARVDRLAIPTTEGDPGSAAMGLEYISAPLTIAPEASATVNREVYAGPTSRKFIADSPDASRMGVAEVVIYTFGGPCAFCTFQSITYLLRGFLGLLHDYVLFDWALAIMLLVVCVRTILHPVTKWSQVNMLRFSKQLQKLAPKQKAIQEKYKNEPLKMREEMARLMREEGVGIGAGAMGCLPALLQTPIWVALSATLYFAFELRHQHAFFGLFQAVSGGQWSFFADLAEPDHFLRMGRSFRIPLISGIMGPIDGLNVMPLLLGVVFFIQQKYLMPPSATQLTPEQEQQQKMMKVMTVVLFPLMMYNAPSGLALYFFMNSSLAIVESRYIRKHAEAKIEAEQARIAAEGPGAKKSWASRNGKKDSGKKPGFFQRLQQLAEERQKMMDEAKRLQAKRDKGKR